MDSVDCSRLGTTKLMLWGIEAERGRRALEAWIPRRRGEWDVTAVRNPLCRMAVWPWASEVVLMISMMWRCEHKSEIYIYGVGSAS